MKERSSSSVLMWERAWRTSVPLGLTSSTSPVIRAVRLSVRSTVPSPWNERLPFILTDGGDKPDLESVVRAFVEPYVRLAEEYGAAGAIVQQFLGRLFIEPGPDIRMYLLREFDTIWAAFSATLQAALPHLEERSVYWRFSHMMGVMYFYLAGRNWLDVRTAGVCDPSDVETTMAEVVAFLVGGLSAAPAGAHERSAPVGRTAALGNGRASAARRG